MSTRDMSLEIAMRLLVPVVRAVSVAQPKLRRGVEGDDQATDAIEAWSRQHRDSARPLVWIHAPSVGEALMAQAIVRELKSAAPELQTFFSHLSPSAERMRERVGADGCGYLPWDTSTVMARAIAALQPNAFAFVRTEIWPSLTRSSHERGVPVLLLNAVLPARSSRLKPLARFALRPAHERLDRVGAINDAAAQRFEQLGVRADRIAITGDARFDQVWQRIAELNHESALLQSLQSNRFTIVAGSTWEADEAHLLPAFAALSKDEPARLIVAPHE